MRSDQTLLLLYSKRSCAWKIRLFEPSIHCLKEARRKMKSATATFTAEEPNLPSFSSQEVSSESVSENDSPSSSLRTPESKKRKSSPIGDDECSDSSNKRMKSPSRDGIPSRVSKLWRDEPRTPLAWPRLVDWKPADELWQE